MGAPLGLALLWLLGGWSYLCAGGDCAMLKDHTASKRRSEFTHKSNKLHGRDVLSTQQDTMTEHMQMLYAKYNQAGFPFKDGNTVRSFKARWGTWCPKGPFYALFLRALNVLSERKHVFYSCRIRNRLV